MVRVLRFPFSFTPSGRAATVEQGSDEETRQLIAAAALTRLGERPLSRTFGIPDPTFTQHGLSSGDIAAVVAEYGPDDVTIVSVEREPVSNNQEIATINWQRTREDEL